MSTNKQWDVNKALAVASLFHFFSSAGNACVIPFLTLYFRQLGLTAPLVGIIIGIKHLISSLWAPLCSYFAKSHRKRKVLITGSLLCSVGTGLLLTLVPPLSKDVVYKYCNISQQSSSLLNSVEMPDMSLNNLSAVNPSTVTNKEMVSAETLRTATDVSVTSGKPPLTSSAFQELFNFTDAQKKNGKITGEVGITADHYNNRPFGKIASSMNAINEMIQELETLTSNETPIHRLEKETKTPEAGLLNVNSNPEKNLSIGGSTEFSLLQTNPHPADRAVYVFENLSSHWEKVRDVNFELLQDINFLDREHQIFLMVLGAVVFWELLAAPLEWMVDDSLYEYLDFVDATDRYGKLWIWSYLGASGGACGITIFVDQLNCFLSAKISRLAVHFYGYAVLITLTLLISVFLPIHVSKKTEHVNKTVKALNLIGSDGRTILSAVTVFLTGVIGSTVQNFLFWQMQDQGSSELYMGVSVAIGLIAEIVLYVFKSKLLRALSSNGTVALSLSCLSAQLLYYSFLWNAWSVLPIQMLCAFSNGALWWAVNMLVDDVASPGTERALHIVLQGLSYGCGASLGSFAGGFVVSHFGLAVLYRACSISLALWLILFLIVQSKLPRQKKINYSRLLAADPSDESDSDEEKERDWLVKAMKDETFSRNW
ncbi:major facilitator superfamily domain-containing protein 6-like [Gopherus evgoodei]|uniref:Major facilitator superfamily associated domain-containing protein n=1 Tax=Gopherus agassizii TaxID=38772 RepID=A0A452I7K8_9SAUR|nr:major facilitator superfamily domain-containing protein 6-like [Gopherus evgoodei]XP_030390429.1 major facilitator superfamily domain-containing protein 6-like [Gopherus evgoodei]